MLYFNAPFCCVEVKAKTRQNSATRAILTRSSAVRTVTSTACEKNKLTRRLVTETTSEKKSSKVPQRQSLSQACARRGLKAYVRRARHRLRQHSATSRKCHVRSGRRFSSETQPTTGDSISEPAECNSSTETAVEELDLSAAKDDHDSAPADFTEDTSSTLMCTEEQELDINVAEGASVTEKFDESVNNVPPVTEEQISTVPEGTASVMLDEHAGKLSGEESVEEVGLNVSKVECSREQEEVDMYANNDSAAAIEAVSVTAESAELVSVDAHISNMVGSDEEDGLTDCSRDPEEVDVCANNAAAAAEKVVSVTAESAESISVDACISNTVASVEEVSLNMNKGECSTEPIVASVSVNGALAAAKELVSFVKGLVSVLAEDTQPVVSDECASNIPTSVEEEGSNMPEGESNKESRDCVSNAPETLEEVVLIVAESTEPVLAVECMTSAVASVEEVDMNVSEEDCSTEPVVASESESSVAAAVNEMILTAAEVTEPDECASDTTESLREVVSVMTEVPEPALANKFMSDAPASEDEVGLNMPEGDWSHGPVVSCVSGNDENATAAVEKVDSFRTEDGAVDESLLSATCVSNSAAPVTEADLNLTEVVTSASEPDVVVMETERDTETMDVLPVPTTTVSSSPVDVMVCSANVLLHIAITY